MRKFPLPSTRGPSLVCEDCQQWVRFWTPSKLGEGPIGRKEEERQSKEYPPMVLGPAELQGRRLYVRVS